MSSQIENLLRVMTNGDKEAKITAIPVTNTPSLFTSQLSGSFSRRRLNVYNNSNASSGECFYGFSNDITPTSKSQVLVKKETKEIKVTTNIPVYVCCVSGEKGDLRFEEIA